MSEDEKEREIVREMMRPDDKKGRDEALRALDLLKITSNGQSVVSVSGQGHVPVDERDGLREALDHERANHAQTGAELIECQKARESDSVRFTHLQCERDALQERLAAAEGEYIRLGTILQQVQAERSELARQNMELQEKYQRIVAEECPSDEKHCGCVPALREEIGRLKSAVEEANVQREEAVRVAADRQAEIEGVANTEAGG